MQISKDAPSAPTHPLASNAQLDIILTVMLVVHVFRRCRAAVYAVLHQCACTAYLGSTRIATHAQHAPQLWTAVSAAVTRQHVSNVTVITI